MTLESSKTLGGIGSILLFIGVIPIVQFTWVLGIVGIILILAGLHGVSQAFGESRIFTNAVYGVVTGVVGIIVSIIVALAAILANLSNIKDFISTIYPGWNGDWTSLPNLTPNTTTLNPNDVLPLVGNIIAIALIVLALLWVFSIISTFFVRRSLKQVSEKSNTGLFSTAGTLLLVGSFLIIIFGLGLLLMWIAALLLAIAFFTLKAPEQQIPPPPTYSAPPTNV